MTVSTTTNKVIGLGNGSNKTFTYSFMIPTAADVEVVYTDALGVQTVISSTLYTITNLGVATGGVVTYPLGTTAAIATGTSLTISRQLALTQPVSISNQNAFYPQITEAAMDRIVMEVQQVDEQIQRTITGPIVDATPMLPLPAIAQRAGKGLIFDALGNPIAGTTPATGVISSAMQPVVNAASLAAGRTALGLGTMAVEGIGRGLQDDGAASVRANFHITAKSTSYLIATTDHLEQFTVTGPITFTLPAASTLWNGFGFWADVYSGTLTLTPNAADAIENNSTGASSYIPTGAKAFVYTNGAGAWFVKRLKTHSAMTTPGGYLSPVTDRAIIFNDAVSTTLYYGPRVHNLIPLYNGAEWIDFPFAELSCPLNATQQTAAQAHDAFVTLVSGVPTLVLGPAWRQAGFGGGSGGFTALTNATPIVCTATSHGLLDGDTVYFTGVLGNSGANGDWVVSGVSGSDFTLTGSVGNGTYTTYAGTFSSRGAGAATTDLTKINGLRVNANQITAYNDVTPYTVSAGKGVYVGTVLIGPSAGQITCHVSPGQSRMWGVWNAYNKADIFIRVSDPTAGWTYASTTIRQSNADATNVSTILIGLPEEHINCEFMEYGNDYNIGIGYATKAHYSGTKGGISSGRGGGIARYNPPPTIGTVEIAPVEYATASGVYSGDPYMMLTVKYRG